ncbi:very short patch repair endonuclease [Mangrovactinospora gilvigrisea]|uniref:very short patch repair endonuclease n=1 Tax=Mangrovactinospora gilvigrisea TaxID=1428644 RepID=UPI0008FC90D2|nr:very short patch repair endonuclease [Mangrovactinospora gilvigrisea]
MSKKKSPQTDENSGSWAAPEGSWASSAANRKSMLGNRNRDTSPELALRRLVHAAGLRYRVAAKPLAKMRRTADMVFRPTRIAVFIDGCYWHGCPDHFVQPKTNPEYWENKIGGNIRRDRETDQRLTDEGWLVLRFWEHQPAEECAAIVEDAVRTRRQALGTGRRRRA